MKKVILCGAMIALLLGFAGTEGSEAKGSEADELARTCADGVGELQAHTLEKAADGSISGEIEVKDDQSVSIYECSNKGGGWERGFVRSMDVEGGITESSGLNFDESIDAAENMTIDPADQIMADFPGFELVSFELESPENKSFSIDITMRSPEGEDLSLICSGEMTDGVIDEYICEEK